MEHVEHDKLAKWVTESFSGIHEEQVGLAEQVLRLQSGRGHQAVDRPAEPDSPQDWHEAIGEVHREIQDLSRDFRRQHREHNFVAEKLETTNSRIAEYESSSRNLQRIIIRGQVRGFPSINEQTQSIVRRELASYRNSLDATMRRVTTVESNIHTLNGMNNRVMAQLSEIEGHVDEAADIIQGVQQNPRGLRERQNVGHRIRSPTPSPTDLPVRPGGGVSLTDHASPNAPVRADASRADRHPIHPVRERADSRSRRALGLPDRSHSPPGRTRDGPQRAFQFPRIGMWVETGARDLLPSPIGDLRSGIGNQGGKGQSAIAGAFLRTWKGRSAIVGAFLRT